MDRLKIFSGSSHPALTEAIAQKLGIGVSPAHTESYSTDQVAWQARDTVRGCDVFVVQTPTPRRNGSMGPNDYLMELCIAIRALKLASADRVTAVMPDYFYERSDKKDKPRIAIAGRLVADLLQTAGADRALFCDLHAAQIQGFFSFPTDHLRAVGPLSGALRQCDLSNAVIVAADVGESADAGRFAKRLGLPLAIIDKRRQGDEKVAIVGVLGDVRGKDAFIVDDQIASAGTLAEASATVMKEGARSVSAVATHAIFSGQAMRRIDESPLYTIIVTDTIPPLPDEKLSPKVQPPVSVADLFAHAIRCIHDGTSISEEHLF